MSAFDYIIAGAGPAGCVLANRLSEDPAVTVLLLEAGGRDSHPLFHMPAGFAKMTKGIASWGWSTVPQTHLDGRVLRYTQAKVLGGGSSINAQIYTRGNAQDYDSWVSEAGCEGWGYRDVLPYFKRAEDNERFVDAYHGTGGPIGVSMPINPLPISEAFLRAAQEYGIPYNPDFNGASQERHRPLPGDGAQRPPLLRRRGLPPPGEVAPNLTVMTGVAGHADRGGAGPRRRRGDRRPAGSSRIPRRPRGASSPPAPSARRACCMLSGIGPADHLRRRASMSCTTCRASAPTCRITSTSTSSANARATTPMTASPEPHRTLWAGCSTLPSARARSPPRSSRPAASGTPTRRRARPTSSSTSGSARASRPASRELKNAGVTLNTAFLRPRSRGTVRLASADPARCAADRSQLLGRPL